MNNSPKFLIRLKERNAIINRIFFFFIICLISTNLQAQEINDEDKDLYKNRVVFFGLGIGYQNLASAKVGYQINNDLSAEILADLYKAGNTWFVGTYGIGITKYYEKRLIGAFNQLNFSIGHLGGDTSLNLRMSSETELIKTLSFYFQLGLSYIILKDYSNEFAPSVNVGFSVNI